MSVPNELRYTKTHEWVRVEEREAAVGITDFAQSQLSDITYVELPGIGDKVTAGNEVAVLESVKAASDIYAPINGTITAINKELEDHPELINSNPYREGWLFIIEPENEKDLDQLLDADEYSKLLPED